MSWLAILSHALAAMATLACLCGLIVTIAGAFAVRCFATRAQHIVDHPPVTVLKPLCGDEPLLEQALASIFTQRYPAFQIVFGVQDAADPALHAVRRMQARFPDQDVCVVVGTASHGPNRKVSNLINMLPASRHDILVFSDSDLHVAPDYLERLVAELAVPGTGLVTTVCSGLPTAAGIGARLGAMHITHSFIPGALLARALGRHDCLGTTMALRRDTLTRIGGLRGLARHLAEDNVLGQLVREQGLRIGLAGTVPATSVPEPTIGALWQHELRWARTICALEPVGFAASMLQFPLVWASLVCLLSDGSRWAFALLAATWGIRAAAARAIDHALRLRRPSSASLWLLPLRDALSVAEIAASFLGGRVVWRGHIMRADDGRYRAIAVVPETDAIGTTLEPASSHGD